MGRTVNRQIIYYRKYFQDYYFDLDEKTQGKIDHALDLIKSVAIIPRQYMKHVRGSQRIYEIRVYARNRSIRLMSFFDRNNQIVILNCFTKKSQKIPKKEIKLAENLKEQYQDEKI